MRSMGHMEERQSNANLSAARGSLGPLSARLSECISCLVVLDAFMTGHIA